MATEPLKVSKWDDLRRRAESILAQAPNPDRRLGQENILRLIHELEVHQVELEVQGEEVRLKNIELQEVLQRYTELYHRAPAGFVSLNVKGRVIEANHAAVEMLGLSKSALKKMGFSRLVYLEDQVKYMEILGRLNRVPRERTRGDLRLMKGGVAPFYAHVEMAPLKNGLGEVVGWLVAFYDISRSKKAEYELQEVCARLEESQKQLKNLSARLLSAQEEERKRIAAELHDSFGQSLAAMKFSIEHALEKSPKDKSAEGRVMLARLVPILQNAIDEVRNIYSGLRPAMLDDLGIIATIGWASRQFAGAFPDIHVEVRVDIQEKDVPDNLKIVIFRIVQEALNNAAKHSRAGRVDMSLKGERGLVVLVVEDDGIGFDMGHAGGKNDERAGIGLASMKERAELSGGSLSISSNEGKGTRVEVRWDTT